MIEVTNLLDFHLNKALRRAPNDPELLSLFGSRGDTLSDEEILRYLKDKVATGKVMEPMNVPTLTPPVSCSYSVLHGTTSSKTRSTQG